MVPTIPSPWRHTPPLDNLGSPYSESGEIERLHISGESLIEEGASELQKALAANTLLKLSFEYIEDLPLLLSSVGSDFRANTSLEGLSFEKMKFTDEQLEQLMAWCLNKPLKQLSFLGCKLSIPVLSQWLPMLSDLSELDLSHTSIGETLPSLTDGLTRCPVVNYLVMNRCEITDSHIGGFAQLLASHPALTYVDLTENNLLRSHGTLADAIEKNGRLTDLKVNTVGFCPIFNHEIHHADKRTLRRIATALNNNRQGLLESRR